jgi:AcrR family transcriptional regulator
MAVGRPRSFDRDEALDKALEVFWRQGYEPTSIAELCHAMGINPPSLYAAFGNKEALFRQALDRYVEKVSVYICEAMAQPTARAAVEKLLLVKAEKLTEPGRPGACMLVSGALGCAEATQCARDQLSELGEHALRERFQRGIADGDLPKDADPAALARYIATVGHGMVIQAAAGATREQLLDVVDMTLKTFPGETVATAASANG